MNMTRDERLKTIKEVRDDLCKRWNDAFVKMKRGEVALTDAIDAYRVVHERAKNRVGFVSTERDKELFANIDKRQAELTVLNKALDEVSEEYREYYKPMAYHSR